ncbi:MAG TPA: YiiD C-terminal domain-containing protein [Spirochaetota bacterium]|nr:YiiD C-terminal domain-containing protein [Spirochaetota bacterium]
MIDEKYKKIADYTKNGIEAIKRTGLTLLECRDNYVKLLMPLEGNVNHIGMMYAGSLFTIGEVSGGAIFGVTFDYLKYIPIVKEVTIRYRKPALSDVTLVVEMTSDRVGELQERTDRNGKADFTLDLEIKDAGDETVALVHGIWQVRKIPEGMKNPLV